VADDYTFKDATGVTRTARADEFGNGQLLPSVGAITAVPDILGYGYASVTTAVALPNITSGATHALMTVSSGGGDIRYRQDATSPAATPTTNANAGLLVQAGGAVVFAGNLSDVRIISSTGTTVVTVEYVRYDQ
jgi:hypothetical protein